MDLGFCAYLRISDHKIRQTMTNPKLKKSAVKLTTFALRSKQSIPSVVKSSQAGELVRASQASQSYCLHVKTNLEPASTTPQQNAPGGKSHEA